MPKLFYLNVISEKNKDYEDKTRMIYNCSFYNHMIPRAYKSQPVFYVRMSEVKNKDTPIISAYIKESKINDFP